MSGLVKISPQIFPISESPALSLLCRCALDILKPVDNKRGINLITYEPLIQLLAYFYIYAFTGWCVEIAYHALTKGHFVNRGMLTGPVCPIYGAGMGIMLIAMRPFTDSWLWSILGSIVICTALELIVGLALRWLFHAQWWDYSNEPFNIAGLICLRFSIAWGFGGAFLIKVVHPLVEDLVALIPLGLLFVLVVIASVIILADLIVTVSGILKICKRHKLLNNLEKEMHLASVTIGEGVAGLTLEAVDNLQPIEQRLRDWHDENAEELAELHEGITQRKEKRRAELIADLAERRAEREERLKQIEAKYIELQKSRLRIEERFEKAFPTMRWFDRKK